jgi:hypothetical protein
MYGIYEFWFIAFLLLTRFPANDFMFPTAVVERSPKFFSCDAAAFILALVRDKRGRIGKKESKRVAEKVKKSRSEKMRKEKRNKM